MPFLADHVVGGRSLLSTVMGIEVMATAVAAEETAAAAATVPTAEATSAGTGGIGEAGATKSLRALAVRDVRVGPPYLLGEGETGEVSVAVARSCGPVPVSNSEASGATLDCELVSAAALRARDESAPADQVHFQANVTVGHDFENHAPPQFAPEYECGDPRVDSGLIYGLFFHGPSFQVLHAAYFSKGVMVGVLSDHLAPMASPAGPTAMAPLLIELAMQTAGLWELGASGRMMIPDSLERVRRYSSLEAYDPTAVYALVTPRSVPVGTGTGTGTESVFDADVVDESGRLHLRVEGYRTTPFGHPPDAMALSGVVSALAGIA